MIFHIEVNHNGTIDYHNNNYSHLSNDNQFDLQKELFDKLLLGDISIKIEVKWVAKYLFIIRVDKTDIYETENSNIYFARIKCGDFKLLDIFNFLIDKAEDLNVQSEYASQAIKKFKSLNDE